MRQMEHPPVVAENLGKKYSRGWALRDCTLQIPAGRVVALVGPNGAGYLRASRTRKHARR